MRTGATSPRSAAMTLSAVNLPVRGFASDGTFSIEVHDILGQSVRTLVDEQQREGRHSIQWNGKDQGGRDVGSGVYFYKLETTDSVKVRRMLLIR